MAQLRLRYDDRLHARLAAEAKRAHRSLNSEIVVRLEASLPVKQRKPKAQQ